MRLSKAQISYFLILGFILVFVIGIGIYFIGNLKDSKIVKEKLAMEVNNDSIIEIVNKFLSINSEDRYIPYSKIIKIVDKSKII